MRVERTSGARKHHWADAVAIVAGVASVGFAMWGIPLRADDVGDGIAWAWAVYAIAGALAILSVVVAQRTTAPARAMLAVAGLALLVVPFALEGAGTTWITNAVLGAAMLLATPFIGYLEPDLPPGPGPR